MATPVHYLPIKNKSPAQRNVKKSKPGSQADFDSVVFYIPVDGLHAANSVEVVSDSPKIIFADNQLGKPTTLPANIVSEKIPVATNLSSPVLATVPARPVASILNGSPLASSSNSAAPSPSTPVASSVHTGSPLAIGGCIPKIPFSISPNLEPSPKLAGILSESNITPGRQVATKPQVKRAAEEKVATLVFFDLETTGLAHEIGKSNVQITEISMIAINRKDFQNSTSSELKDIRVIQKMSLCTRPRARISPGAAKVTGLKDGNLIDQQPFDQNVAAVITTFLNHLPKPVCLVAHNGDCYDFPLLKAELNRLSIHLSSDILIADTLKAFRALGVPVFPPERKIAKSVKYGKRGISYALDNLHLYFFNKKPVGSHSSEGDCIALAKVCHMMKDLMLPWIDESCSTMDNVVSMW